MTQSTVKRLRLLALKNKYAVDLDCGHTLVIDVTVDDAAKFDRRCKVRCGECELIENNEQREIGGDGGTE